MPDMLEGFTQPSNQLLLKLLKRIDGDLIKLPPQEKLDHCLELSMTWTENEDTHRGKVPRTELFKKANTIRELIEKTEDPIRAEKNFRSWLQRTITCNATVQEPTPGKGGELRDPYFEASEKLAILNSIRLLSDKKGGSVFFPLRDTKLEYRLRIPIGIDVFDQNEWEGGPEFDTLMLLSGESNVGKTMLGLYLMSSLATCRKNTLIISGEDSEAENKKRILCHHLRATASEIANMSEKERDRKMEENYGDPEDPESLHYHLRNKFASICPEEGKLTPSYIEEKIDAIEQEIQEPIHAIMIDYLQKTKPDGKNNRMQRDEELEVFVNQVKENGEDKRLTLLISQTPSHAVGGKTEFLGIKEATARSYAATWGAHYIVTINRTQEETERLRSSNDKRARLNFFLCKNKNGPIGTCYGLGYPKEARWRFFRTKSEMLRAVDNNPQEAHST